MYADGNDERKPDLQESYAGAVSTGNSRVEPHKVTRADLIAAAGMSIHGTGTALMRLVSEWQSGAAPYLPAEPAGAKDLARQAAVERVNAGIQASEEEYGGMRVSAKQDRRTLAPITKHEVEFGQAEARRLASQCTDWHLHEHMLRFQRLKTLPTIRAALLHWVTEKGWDDGEYLVAKVLQYFLSPHCPACGGSGVREFAGNNKKSAGKPCPKCREHKVRGEVNVPCHGQGRALLAYMRACTGRAAKDVSEGAYRPRRSGESEHNRENHKASAEVEKQRRADAEAKADMQSDPEAAAAKFRDSLGAPRQR